MNHGQGPEEIEQGNPQAPGGETEVIAAFSRFTHATFLAHGIALLPFFAFNRWFTLVDPVPAWLGLLEAVGTKKRRGLRQAQPSRFGGWL